MVKESVEAKDIATRALLLPSTNASPREAPTMRDMSVTSLLNDANEGVASISRTNNQDDSRNGNQTYVNNSALLRVKNSSLDHVGDSSLNRAVGGRKRKA